MLIKDTVTTALKGVTRNVSRSMLTMLGIIIGVGAVVLMSSIGASMQGVILSQISSLGPKSMVIFPGNAEGGMTVSTGFDSLTFDDVAALERLSSIETVAPNMFLPGDASYQTEEMSPQTIGVLETFFSNQNISAKSGRLIEKQDVDGARAVAVLGTEVEEKLFGSVDPIGKRIQIGDNYFTVIGVANALGSQFFQSADNRIYVPFSVVRSITGQKYVNYITMNASGNFDVAIDDVKFLLRQRHGIDNPTNEDKNDDFIVRTSEQAGAILGAVSLGFTLFITMIATISLIVGGIGIMNIMLVSVSERTQEIGLRKAIGARGRDILLQFLIESVLLTVIGGLIGMVGGISLAMVVAMLIESILATYDFALSVPSMIAAFLMATATGLFFGISPARKAAALHPIEALRYE